MSALSSLKNP